MKRIEVHKDVRGFPYVEAVFDGEPRSRYFTKDGTPVLKIPEVRKVYYMNDLARLEVYSVAKMVLVGIEDLERTLENAEPQTEEGGK